MATQGHGERPLPRSRRRTLGKKYRTATVPSMVVLDYSALWSVETCYRGFYAAPFSVSACCSGVRRRSVELKQSSNGPIFQRLIKLNSPSRPGDEDTQKDASPSRLALISHACHSLPARGPRGPSTLTSRYSLASMSNVLIVPLVFAAWYTDRFSPAAMASEQNRRGRKAEASSDLGFRLAFMDVDWCAPLPSPAPPGTWPPPP